MKNKKTNRNKSNAALAIAAGLLLLAGWILVFLARWVFSTWAGLRMDELIFQLKAPIEGTGDGIVMKGVLSSLLPALGLTALFFAVVFFLREKRGILLRCGAALGVLLIIGAGSYAWKKLDMTGYVRNQLDESRFIEDNYVDPADVAITFPARKRHLIYIYMESMASTYAERKYGAALA